MLAYSTTNALKDEPILANPIRDEAHFASGRHFERLEGGGPAAPLKASQITKWAAPAPQPDSQQALERDEQKCVRFLRPHRALTY